MKRKTIILVSLLLVLYIVPYASPFIPTEPNMNKAFSIAIGEAWLDGWYYRRACTITGSGGAGTDYQIQIPVTYDSDMQTDFDDIRFTDNDGNTTLDYWIETFTASTNATFWVKVDDDLGTSKTIYMYYGNSTVSNISSGSDTFVFYEDWTSETVGAQWTIENSAGSVSFDDTDANHGSVIRVQANAGADIYSIHSDNDYTSSYALRWRTYSEETAAASQYVKSGWEDIDGLGRSMFSSYQGNPTNYLCMDDDGNADNQLTDSSLYDSWHTFDSRRIDVVGNAYTLLYVDDVQTEIGSNHPDALGYSPYFYVRDSEYDLYNDWVVVRKNVDIEPEFDSFGSEETGPSVPQWNDVAAATVYFHVPFDYWAFDMILIFLGLAMIILGSLYAAYKIQNDPDRDTIAIVLLLFMFGFGLFLGGIGFLGGV